MPFVVDVDKIKYEANAYDEGAGTQCVALVKLAPKKYGERLPQTSQWRRGLKVAGAAADVIEKGTVIATFDDDGKYPGTERHAAIYLSHDSDAIRVIDQWKAKTTPGERDLKFRITPGRSVNNGNYYWVVETADTLVKDAAPCVAPQPAAPGIMRGLLRWRLPRA